MSSKNIVPRADADGGGIGTAAKRWSLGYFQKLILGAGTTAVAPIQINAGTNLTSPVAGSVEYDGAAPYFTPDVTTGRGFISNGLLFRLDANGSAISTIADFFGTNDGIPLIANGIYEIDFYCYTIQNSGAGTHVWTLTTSTNTVITNLQAEYIMTPTGGMGTAGAPQVAGLINQSGTSQAFAMPASGSNSAANHFTKIHTVIKVGATGGNIRLRLTVSANNATPQLNSYCVVKRLPAGNTGAFVA